MVNQRHNTMKISIDRHRNKTLNYYYFIYILFIYQGKREVKISRDFAIFSEKRLVKPQQRCQIYDSYFMYTSVSGSLLCTITTFILSQIHNSFGISVHNKNNTHT